MDSFTQALKTSLQIPVFVLPTTTLWPYSGWAGGAGLELSLAQGGAGLQQRSEMCEIEMSCSEVTASPAGCG